MQNLVFYVLIALFCIDIIRKRINPLTEAEIKQQQKLVEEEDFKKTNNMAYERIKESQRLEKEQKELENIDLSLEDTNIDNDNIINSSDIESKTDKDYKVNQVNKNKKKKSTINLHFQYE